MAKPHLVLKGGIWRAYPSISTHRENYLFSGAGLTPEKAISTLEYLQRMEEKILRFGIPKVLLN